MNREVPDEDLTAYVDEALEAARRAEVEVWLADHPEAEAQVAADRRLNQRLRQTFDLTADTALSPAATRSSPRRMLPLAWAASLLLALALGGGLGWALRPAAAPAALGLPSLVVDAIDAHRTYTVEGRHAVEVPASDAGHLATWFGHRLGQLTVIPDLTDVGFSLVGGRLLPTSAAPAALLMYEDASGQRLTLYWRAGSGPDPTFRFASAEGENAVYWSDATMDYAVTGAFPPAQLEAICAELQSIIDPLGRDI